MTDLSTLPELSLIETRILGTLFEKQRTVPDTYPLSLNALQAGCNQKTSRHPVIEVQEAELVQALEALRERGLVAEVSGSRVTRYEHRLEKGLGVPGQAASLIAVLMLRGPQTAGELRINTERWYRFADISSVEGFLHELPERADDKGGPLVLKRPRTPGTREDRWAHLICGPVEISPESIAAGASGTRADGQNDRISALEAEVAALRATVERLCAELGVSPAQPDGGGAHAKNENSLET